MSKLPQPNDSLSRRLAALEERVKRAESRTPFFNTGLTPTGAGGLTLQGVPLEPFIQQVARCEAGGFAVTTSPTTQASVTVTVPQGCTSGQVTAFGRFYAVNQNTTGGSDTTGSDAIYVKVGIGTALSLATPTGISGGNGYATTVGFDVFELFGLTEGDTLTFTVKVSSGIQALPAYADNYVSGIAAITWLR